jgi:hypothetical protein
MQLWSPVPLTAEPGPSRYPRRSGGTLASTAKEGTVTATCARPGWRKFLMLLAEDPLAAIELLTLIFHPN